MNIKELISRDRFAKLLGVELLEAEKGHAKAKLELREEHHNAIGMAQGGAIFSLADLALAAAANSHGNIAVTVSINSFFVKPVSRGILYAEAKETSRNNKLATYSISVKDESNELIAEFQGMVYRRNERFDDIK